MTPTLEAKIKLFVEGLEQLSSIAQSISDASLAVEELGAQATASSEPVLQMWESLGASLNDVASIDWSSFGIDEQLAQTSVNAQDAGQALSDIVAAAQDAANAMNDAASGSSDAAGAIADAAQASTDAAGTNQQLATSARDVSQAMQDATAGSNDFSGAQERVEQAARGSKSELDSLGQQFDFIAGRASLAMNAFIAFAGVMGLKAAADVAARNETLGVTLDIIAKNAGYTTEAISQYEEGLKKLGITTSAARNSLTQMIQSGLQVGPAIEGGRSQIEQLARASQDLAVVSGENSSQTLQRLITNIQQLDTMGLRWMGIVVDMEKATNDYAMSLGKTAGALTSSERQQALLNATMEKAGGLAGAYEASMNTVGKQLSSMSRYQEEAAAAIGETLLPAYGQLVRGATEFLKVTKDVAEAVAENGTVAELLASTIETVFAVVGGIGAEVMESVQSIAPALGEMVAALQVGLSSFDIGGVTGAVEVLLDLVTELAVYVIEAFTGAAPAVSALGVAFNLLTETVTNVFSEVSLLDALWVDSATAGQILGTVIESLGMLVAGLADGVSILTASMRILSGIGMDAFAAIAGAAGVLIGKVFPETGRGIQDLADKFSLIADKQVELGQKTFAAFSRGDTAIARYAASLKEVPKAYEEEKKAADNAAEARETAFKGIESQVLGYVRAVNESKLSGEAAANEFKRLSEELAKVKTEAGLSEAQVNGLAKKLETARDKGSDLTEAFKKMKLDANEFASGVSAAGSQAVQGFNDIVASGQFAAGKLYEAFGKGLNMETSLRGLKNFSEAAENAFSKGKLGVEQYSSALVLVGSRFDELFSKSMATAKTREDFAQLREQVLTLGESGAVSGSRMVKALSDISEAVTGTKARISELIAESLRISEANLSGLREETQELNALVSVRQAERDLARAVNQSAKEGTAEARAAEGVARATLDVKRAQLEVQKAQAALQEEMRAMAEAEAEFAAAKAEFARTGSEADLVAMGAAEKRKEALEQSLSAAKESVIEAEALAEKTEQAAIKAKEYADNLADAAKNAQDTSLAGDKAARSWEGVRIAALSTKNVAFQLEQAGYSSAEAWERAVGIMGSADTVVAGFGTKGIQRLEAVKASIEDAKKALEAFQAQEAQNSEQASNIREAYAEVATSTEAAIRGLPGWASGAQVIAEAYRDIQLQASRAAESAVGAARGLLNAAQGIREELLSAQGKEEELAQMRFQTRRRELDIQYKQLDVQLRIAMAQAKAAGIDTSELAQAQREAQLAYRQAMEDLSQLEAIDNENRKKKAAEEAAAIAAQAKTSADAEVDSLKKGNSELEKRLSLTQQEADARNSINYEDIPALNNSSVQSIAQGYSVPTSATQETSLNTVDVSKIVLEHEGKQAEIYTNPNQKEDLMNLLTNLKKRM